LPTESFCDHVIDASPIIYGTHAFANSVIEDAVDAGVSRSGKPERDVVQAEDDGPDPLAPIQNNPAAASSRIVGPRFARSSRNDESSHVRSRRVDRSLYDS
jgi:hypothetical protein